MTQKDHYEKEESRRVAVDALNDFKEKEAASIKKQKTKGLVQKKRKTLRLFSQWTIIVVCLVIIGFQFPKLMGDLTKEAKPLRKGTMATDTVTDQCIAELWKVSKLLQEKKLPGADIICPASRKPFEILETDDDVIARSPKPELYGFKEIRVSRKEPIPKLIK